MTLFTIILATILVGLISLVGLFFSAAKIDPKKLAFYFMSLASGTMLGSTFLHLLPESLENNPHNALTLSCLGVLLFFILEKFLIWRHCHLHEHHEDFAKPTATKMVVMGDSIHNFIDGVIIASSFLAGPQVGISVTTAIILHEIPQELGDFGVLLNGGYPVKKALFFNFLSGLAALFGAILAYFFFGAIPLLQANFLPIAAGGFLYIALADLIPQLHGNLTLRQTVEQIALLTLGILMLVFLKHGA